MANLLKTDEAASLIGVTRQWLGELVRAGRVRAQRGSRRRYLFDPADIESFKKTYATDSNPLPMKERKG